jgi:hypothetical protein
MAKTQIGFVHDAPENSETKWERRLDDATVTYTKTCVGGGFFIYDCECRRGATTTATSWQTSSDSPRTRLKEYLGSLISLQGKLASGANRT